jgi:CD2 antigen cytoplasmic tail-binding protein 2
MFGDAKPTDAKGKAKASDPLKKGDKFLSLGEIEGQEFGKGDDEGDESDDSKDGMGYELSSFNMKNELKEGAFTEEGAYVQSAKDPMEMHDRWLEGVEDKGVMRRAREAKARRDREEEEKKQREVDELRDGSGKGREDLVREIADMLEPGETVLLGLQRLGGGGGSKDKGKEKATGGKKLSWVERQKERKTAMAEAATASSSSGGGMDVDSTTLPASSSADPSIPSTPFDRLSTITTDLTAMGQLDLYSMSREALQRLLPRPPPPQQSAPPLDDGTSYEYRFSMDHLRSLPEAERPVEREVFGSSRFPLLCCASPSRSRSII